MNQLGLQWWDYAVIVAYFVSMLAIGWYFSKRNSNAADFLLGGRKMPYFPVAVSMLMTVFSTYSLVMGPGEIYNHGLDWGVLGLIMPFIGVVSVIIFTPILPNLPTLSLSHRVHKTVLYISVSFAVSYTGLLLPSF